MRNFPPDPLWPDYFSEEEFKAILSDKSRWPELYHIYSRQSIRNWCKKFGISRGKPGPESRFEDMGMTKDDWFELIWVEKRNKQELADRWNTVPSVISYYLKKHSIPYPTEQWELHFTKDELRALLSKGRGGANVVQLATGVSIRTCFRWRDKYLGEEMDDKTAHERQRLESALQQARDWPE